MRRRIVEVFDSDKLFRIKHGAGLLDFRVTGGTGLLWKFPDGTTSTASRPAKTVTAGETLLYCDNWSAASLQLNDNSTDANYLGDLSDLPALTTTLFLVNCSNITGVYSAVNANNVPTTTILSNTGLSATDMDNTLIAYAACTKNNGSFTATGMTRTAASDDAVTALSGRGWSITGITKV